MTERHSLLDGDATPTQERENVFDDQFEADDFDFDGVADGFRPNVDREGVRHDAGEARQGNAPDEDTIEPVIWSVSTHYASNPISPSRSRNSMRKSRTYANPFASPEDDAEQEPRMEFEPDQASVRRSGSSTSSRMYAQTNSPRFGAGPSHPYGMYQQGTIARTASVATTSTLRPSQRQSFSQNAPQHPYSMYPQGVGEDDLDGDEEPLHHNPVPVGFPGIGQSYTRRMGPDGEDQDIIGEDGHTEQLPPYTRYPEEGPEKMPLLPTALHSRAPVHGTDPGMALMHTALLPTQTPAPPQPMSDESTLVERRGSGSHLALVSSRGSDSERSFSEKTKKPWKEKTWKERRKTKLLGIPMWWLWLALGVLIFIGAVLGGVIGGFVAGSNKSDNDDLSVITSLWDASPVASPTSAVIPTGTYALSLGEPEETQCDCLTVQSQRPAWDCNLTPNSDLAIVVGQGQGGSTGASVQYASHDMSIVYGAQLGMMNTSMASFLTVLDKDDPNNGVAFYFQQYYDKVVVLPNNAISMSKNKRNGKRQGNWHPDFRVPAAWQARKQLATPGEKPWFCVWNSTFLEGFIYVTEQSQSTSSSAPALTNSTYLPASTSAPPTTAATAATTATATPTSYLTTTHIIPMPTTTATLVATLAPGEQPPWVSAGWSDKEHSQYLSDLSAEANGHKEKRQPIDSYESLPRFPYVLKLEERRVQLPNSVPPYCQLYQVLDDGTANWVQDPDNNGDPIIVNLSENDMTFGAYTSAEASADKRRKRGAVPGACHCQWMSGE